MNSAFTPILNSVNFRNKLSHELHLGIEPEGDCVTIGPSQLCKIVPRPLSEDSGLEIEIDYEQNLISIHLMCDKEIYIDNQRVR
jgi:hypothetical protein